MENKITKENLIKFGMIETTDDSKFLYPIGKELFEDSSESSLMLVITRERNIEEFALLLPDGGGTLFLGGIANMDQLKAFQDAITSWEPKY